MAKKDFEWKETQQIGMVDISERKRVLVSFNSLSIEKEDTEEDKWYVSLTTLQLFRKKGSNSDEPTWNITKNATFPMDTWMEISEMVNSNLEDE